MQFALTSTLSDGTALTSSITLNDAFAPDFLAWAAEVYFPQGVLVTPANPAANPPVAAVYRAPTNQELHDAAWQGIETGMAAHVTDYRNRKAIAAALATVVPVT